MDVEMGHAPSYLVKIGGATTCGFLIGCARLCYLLRRGLLPTYLGSELVECHRFVVGNWAMGCCDTHRHFVCQIPTCTYLYRVPTYNLCSVGTKTHANCQAPFFHHVTMFVSGFPTIFNKTIALRPLRSLIRNSIVAMLAGQDLNGASGDHMRWSWCYKMLLTPWL